MAMNYSFQGVYKELLTGYVEEKYALGLKFTAQVRRLKQFDQLSFSFSCRRPCYPLELLDQPLVIGIMHI